MEDGVKEDTAKPKEVKPTDKAGWLKKSSGKFLASYKDRYIQLDRTEILVYESDDLKNCLERVDLENYDKCHELRSAFKKKNRLVLIRGQKSGNKVHDIKLQAQTPEEKEAWIKALSDGINRAKNKIFDEVKVNEECSLEHVTRNRPKGNRARRPPTRIHMKEVASVSSDGILRLDLDDAESTPNGTHYLNLEGNGAQAAEKKPVASSKTDGIPEETKAESSVTQQKILKPPMPPLKENSASEEPGDESTTEEMAPPKKILKPPMPPSKEQKPRENKEEETTNVSLEASSPPKNLQPPTPPTQNTKPSLTAVLEDKDIPKMQADSSGSEEKDNLEEVAPDVQKGNEKGEALATVDDVTICLPSNILKPQGVMWDSSNTTNEEHSAKQGAPESAIPASESKESSNTAKDVTTANVTPIKPATQLTATTLVSPEPVKKGPGPPAPPKKKPLKPVLKMEECTNNLSSVENLQSVSTSTSVVSESAHDVKDDAKHIALEPKSERKVVILSLNDMGKSAGPCDLSTEHKDVEEKSVDSGQHSADESESSDHVTSSAVALQVSDQDFDGETSKNDTELSDSQVQSTDEDPFALPSVMTPDSTQESSIDSCASSSQNIAQNKCAAQSPHPPVPIKPPIKRRSASLVDLLSEPSENRKWPAGELPVSLPGSDMKELQNKVSLELEKTGELLDAIVTKQPSEAEKESLSEGGPTPEILLSTAMEKLRKADEFLREAKSFTEPRQFDKKSKRSSW
ncbi:pleckstrin homology domain-containing family O member 2 [Chanos chanos]|uniref:Pleckstrin homology domain-containing family O member 2 n=1 Tax=Chanos chanos TaxID=29144 RepID=A0A6J2UNV4_CHACN|nr:pleckstrin homology domain-containing family O member 2 [Chanos chanos]